MKTYPNFSHLIGVPYTNQNCFELVKAFYRDVFSIDVKHYCDTVPTKRSDIQNLIYSNIGDFEKVEHPRFGDIVVLRVYGLESHIGIYIDEDRILHASRIAGSIIDRSSRWKNLISGFYRLRGD